MDEKGKDFLGCSEDVLHRNERSNTVQHCTEDNWPSVVLSLSQVCNTLYYISWSNHKNCQSYDKFVNDVFVPYLLGAGIAWPSFSLFGGE